MLNKAVLAFIEKVNSDPSLHGKVAGEARLDVMVGIAAENGFDFSGDEWISTVQGLYSGELNDADLANVAGGALNAYKPPSANPLGFNQPQQGGSLIPGANATGIPNFSIGHQGSH